MNRARADALAVAIDDQLAAAMVDAATTVDSTTAGPELDAGGAVVIITPPRVSYETFDQASAEWELIATCGPNHEPHEAWARLDTIIAALRVPLAVAGTEPATFQPQQGPSYPAQLIRFTEHYTITE